MSESADFRLAYERAKDATTARLGPEPKDDAAIYAVGALFGVWALTFIAVAAAGVDPRETHVPDVMGIGSGILIFLYKHWAKKRWYKTCSALFSLEKRVEWQRHVEP